MVLTLAVAAMTVAPASAQQNIQKEWVHFEPGATSATVKARIKGDQIVAYALHARAGQTLKVSLNTSSRSNYFNVMAPGNRDAAIFVGSTSGNHFGDVLRVTGDYRVRVYLMASAARRNESADYTISFELTKTPLGALGPKPKVIGAP